jgi:DNA polymerase III epsilon subunit-like protein
VFDVETANNQRDSICSIGVIRYENNQVVFEKEILINPEAEFNWFNTTIHGIKASDVANMLTFPEIWDKIKKYFDQTILVAHNAKSMDLCALYRTLERYHLPSVDNNYICTLELAKGIFRNDAVPKSYGLDVLSKFYEINLLHHHNALEDTSVCFEILKKFEKLYPSFIIAKHYNYEKSNKKCGSSKTNAMLGCFCDKTKKMQKLQKIIFEIVEDNVISDDEIMQLKVWLEQHEDLNGFYPFDKIFELVEDIMMDGELNEAEEQELLCLLDAFINPQTENVEIDFCGKLVCLSGVFKYGSKKQVEDFLLNYGAVIANSVTGKLNVLILGEAGSTTWKYGNYGSKYEKACQLNEKGKSIIIIKENDVILDGKCIDSMNSEED